MRKNFKCIVLFAILFSVLFSISAAEVVVSPKMRSLSYSMQTTPDSLAEQLGLDSQSLILSTDTDTVTAQLQLDRLVAISDPGYVLVPGDTISVSYMERTGTNPVTLHITIPYGGTIRISSIATVETEGRTFQSVRSEIEAILTQYNRYANPIITIQGLGLFHVSINGEVTSSRSIRVNGNSFLSDVLYYGAATASSRLVTIKSADGTERSYDPYLGMRRGESSNNPRLQPGDVITLHKKDRAVTISGAVNDKGTYQLLEGENLSALISYYAMGLDAYASDTVTIQRSRGNGYYETMSVPVAEDFELKDGDIVYVEPVSDSLGSVSIEGALASSSSNSMIQGDRSETYYYRFVDGETVYDMLSAMSGYFTPSSNLSGAYLVRDGETLMLDFNEILYNGAESGELTLKSSDRFYIPFNQMLVSVIGGVVNPGVYGYVPGRSADYYINLAGGYSENSKGTDGLEIKGEDGRLYSLSDPLEPETTITVERDDLSSQVASTVAVIGIVTSVVGLIASIVTISANLATWPNI